MRRMTFLILVALAACGQARYPVDASAQEPVTDVAFLPAPNVDNPVLMGVSLHERPDLRAEAVAVIASWARGTLPGVRFYVARGWVNMPPGTRAESYRNWGTDGHPCIVLGWWPSVDAADGEPAGTLELPGAEWETDHMREGIDDFGRPVPP
jgi:hypothetical protein